MKKLEEFKYDGLNFYRLSVPDSYVSYTYNKSLTVLENIYALWNEIEKIDVLFWEVKALLNAMVEFLNGEGLEQQITAKLTEWLNDGTLEDLINEALFNQKLDKSVFDDEKSRVDGELERIDEYVELKGEMFISLKEFGAVGDGVTDDTISIQNAFNFAKVNNVKVVADGDIYLVTNTIKILQSCDLSLATFIADGRNVSPIIQVGQMIEGVQDAHQYIKLPSVKNYYNGAYQRNWTGSGIGVRLVNFVNSTFDIKTIDGFTKGLQCYGFSKGFAYNTINLQAIDACRVCLELDSDTVGWTNENTFNNGRFYPRAHLGGDVPSDWVGTKAIHVKQGNNNLFLKPCIESPFSEYGIEINRGSYNTFINARYEGLGSQKVYFNSLFNDSTHSNLFIGGYDINRVKFIYNDVFTSKYNAVLSGRGNNMIPVIQSNQQTFYSGNNFLEEKYDTWYLKIDNIGGLSVKAPSDTEAKVSLTPLGELKLSDTRLRHYNEGLRIDTKDIYPLTDNFTSLGKPSNKFKDIYADSGIVNTSDERKKQDIKPIDEKVLLAWSEIEWVEYRFIESVEEKGKKARKHTGLIAQQIYSVFEKHGLNAFDYGVLCFDEWVNEDGLKINAFGVRYQEAQAIENAYQRSVINKLK